MADVAKNTVKVNKAYYTPGQEILGLSAAQRKELLAAGAIIVTEELKPAAKEGKKSTAKGAKNESKANKGAKKKPEANDAGAGEQIGQTDESNASESGEDEEVSEADESDADEGGEE